VHSPTLLVVDDQPNSRELLGEYLSAAGYRVELAGDGMEALERLRRAVPSAVVLDLHMPRMDGWQLRAAMAADPRLRPVPVIVVSALHGASPPLGIAGFVPKPLDAKALLSLLARVCGAPGRARQRGAA